ncbi:MAG: DUF1638 domain-containing protein [Clostridia bacterium]
MNKIKLICCEVLKREAVHCMERSNMVFDVEYTKKSSHRDPAKLQKEIQDIIDRTRDADAVILGFGLCGNTLNGMKAGSIPLVIPKAHDCCTLYLGSRDRYQELFSGNESMPWGSTGYSGIEYEHDDFLGLSKEYEDFVVKYGEENARFIWDVLHPKSRSSEALFIVIPETYSEEVHLDFVEKAGKEELSTRTVPGDLGLIRKLLEGLWDDDFLVVPPGEAVQAQVDSRDVIGCVLK